MQLLKPLCIGKYTIPIPIIQGGMGVGVSWDTLPGTVSKLGGLGTISAVGTGYYSKSDAPMRMIEGRPFGSEHFYSAAKLFDIVRNARKICGDAPLACNILYAINDYGRVVQDAVAAGVNIIVTGAGLPLDLPKFVKETTDVALVPIVSSGKALKVICRRWKKDFNRLPDAVIVEGPLSGGHLGFKKHELHESAFDLKLLFQDVQKQRDVFGSFPIIVAGGIYSRDDINSFLSLGADAVQMATRFIVTDESGASEQFKDTLIQASPDDIKIIDSPVGHPARAVFSELFKTNPKQEILHDVYATNTDPLPIPKDKDEKIRCLSNCVAPCNRGVGANAVGFCIANALGDALSEVPKAASSALYFTGANGYRLTERTTVRALFEELFPEYNFQKE